MRVLLCLDSIAVSSGCGGSGPKIDPKTQATVSGSITFDGKPIPVDSGVYFSSKDTGTTAAGKIDAKGNFIAKPAEPQFGFKAGTYQVTVRAPGKPVVANSPTSANYQKAMMSGGKPVKPADADEDSALVPKHFNNVDTTNLILEVKPGANTFPIDLAKIK